MKISTFAPEFFAQVAELVDAHVSCAVSVFPCRFNVICWPLAAESGELKVVLCSKVMTACPLPACAKASSREV